MNKLKFFKCADLVNNIGLPLIRKKRILAQYLLHGFIKRLPCLSIFWIQLKHLISAVTDSSKVSLGSARRSDEEGLVIISMLPFVILGNGMGFIDVKKIPARTILCGLVQHQDQRLRTGKAGKDSIWCLSILRNKVSSPVSTIAEIGMTTSFCPHKCPCRITKCVM